MSSLLKKNNTNYNDKYIDEIIELNNQKTKIKEQVKEVEQKEDKKKEEECNEEVVDLNKDQLREIIIKEEEKTILYQDHILQKSTSNKKKNIVIITSKIIVSNNKFDYINNRSIYTKEQRLEQTLETIKTIKQYIPNYFIILLDNSNLNQNDSNLIKSTVDVFLNPVEDMNLKYYTDECLYKAYGELNQTKLILDFINNFIDNNIFEIENLFKISGRYLINNNFNYSNFNCQNNIFKINENIKNRKYYYTSFYKISNINFTDYSNVIYSLTNEIKNTNKYNNLDYEVFFPPKLKNIKL